MVQLVLDSGASEVVPAVNVDDADNLFDWLSASDEVYYDLEREIVLSGARPIRLLTPPPAVPTTGTVSAGDQRPHGLLAASGSNCGDVGRPGRTQGC